MYSFSEMLFPLLRCAGSFSVCKSITTRSRPYPVQYRRQIQPRKAVEGRGVRAILACFEFILRGPPGQSMVVGGRRSTGTIVALNLKRLSSTAVCILESQFASRKSQVARQKTKLLKRHLRASHAHSRPVT